MADGVTFNVDQALAKLGELVQQHGPQAVDLAAQVVQADAYGHFIRGGAFLLLAIVVLTAAIIGTRWALRNDDEDGAVFFIGVGFFHLPLWLAAAWPFLNIWNWIATTNPKLALAHQVLSKVAGL